jgi:hypothetical protein
MVWMEQPPGGALRESLVQGDHPGRHVENNKSREQLNKNFDVFLCTELFVLSYLFNLEGSLIDYGVNFKATG